VWLLVLERLCVRGMKESGLVKVQVDESVQQNSSLVRNWQLPRQL
jgi:hypothetical protein